MTNREESTQEQQKESLSELRTLFFKGQLSFNTILFVRETYTRNLELDFGYKLPINNNGRVIKLKTSK